MASAPRTVEQIFKDYSARRAAIVRALTHDVDEFYNLCDPEKENLCLYGHPNETWEVTLPAEEVPPELPEPALGINFARDGMNRKDWLSLIAVHSDCWLISVAFYHGARLNRNERKHLYSMIDDLPTAFEVVSERKPDKDKPSLDSGNRYQGNNNKVSWITFHQDFLLNPSLYVYAVLVADHNLLLLLSLGYPNKVDSLKKFSLLFYVQRLSDGNFKSNPKLADRSFEDDEEEHGETLCGSCGGNYNGDEFWIGCDICERWFHGKCVKITPAKAESIKQYKCPSCSIKKGKY